MSFPQEKTEPKDIETLQHSRKIMSKLMENLTVVVDGPGKLKLATSPYPKLRDEKGKSMKSELAIPALWKDPTQQLISEKLHPCRRNN